MKIAAIYRLLYGEDFIEWSIRSLIDYVDEVWVFWTNDVWGKPKGVDYKGEFIEFPKPIDGAVERVRNIASDKIRIVEAYHGSPFGQYAAFCNTYKVDADVTVIVEWDHIFPADTFKKNLDAFIKSGESSAGTPQIEFWKSPQWYIPGEYRHGRIGSAFWRKGHQGQHANGGPCSYILPHPIHNYGLAASPKTIYWKHLTAMAFSKIIGDRIPSDDWYEEVWLKWTPKMRGLECNKDFRNSVPKVERVECLISTK